MKQKSAKDFDGDRITVEQGCGCVFCDLDLEPSTRITNIFSTNAKAEYYHPTKRGDVPCTKPR